MPNLPPACPYIKTNKPRPSSTARGYDHKHRKRSEYLRQKHPLCMRCKVRWSEHLHHKDHDVNNNNPENLEPICRQCHHAEHHPA